MKVELSLIMPVRFQQDQQPDSIYFITFTCYKWLPLLHQTNTYDAVYKWFNSLCDNKIHVTVYVIMPNHVHVLLHFPQMPKSLNILTGNAKRFMAYEIVKRLKEKNANDLPDILQAGLKQSERK
ncbi:MAG: transposase [Chitinophagaceae bacterium]|jgi:REP element-mobilizing transposase RayT|nr:transposase [Chitinophagaceae bacterium]